MTGRPSQDMLEGKLRNECETKLTEPAHTLCEKQGRRLQLLLLQMNLQLEYAEAFAAAQTCLCLTNQSVSQPTNQSFI